MATKKKQSQEIQHQQKEFDQAEYARQMRLELSEPNQRLENGDLNHQYFLVKKNQFFTPDKIQALYRGLEVFGVGEWEDIKEFEFNGKANDIELELRTQLLLGVQDLQQYMGQRLTKQQIAIEKEKNQKLGQQKNSLKHGLYKNY